MAGRMGDRPSHAGECDAPDPRLLDGRRAAPVANCVGRCVEPPGVVLPRTRAGVPGEAGRLRPRPPGGGPRLPPSRGSVLRHGRLLGVPVPRRLGVRDVPRRAASGRGRTGQLVLREPEGRAAVRPVHVLEEGRDAPGGGLAGPGPAGRAVTCRGTRTSSWWAGGSSPRGRIGRGPAPSPSAGSGSSPSARTPKRRGGPAVAREASTCTAARWSRDSSPRTLTWRSRRG